MMRSAREIVTALLLRAEAAGQYADRALDAALSREQGLDVRDKAFVTTLFYGVIEHRITLDYIIDSRSKVAPSQIEREVRMTLRVALYQLLYLDRVPDHAAVAEAVDAVTRRSKGFVNAILRGFCREGKQIAYPQAQEAPLQYLSVRYSVPQKTAARFVSVFGRERAESILAAFQQHPPVCVRTNTLRLTRDALLSRVAGAAPTKNAPYGVFLPDNVSLHALLAEGLCFVQDEASQIAVASLDARPGMRVIDLCAAPGSKSFGAALDMADEGELCSFDLHENKISLIRRGAAALGISCLRAEAADARLADAQVLGSFDRVICDVPCSGFGVLAKKPDIRYKDIDEAAGLLPVQAAILHAAAPLVRKGGVLLYSTCTLLPEENEGQVTAFLEAHPEFRLTPFTVGEITSDGMLTLTPDLHGTDGFFIAKLQRT